MRGGSRHANRLPSRRLAGQRKWGRAAGFLHCAALLNGCAVGDFGTVAANVEQRDTVTVVVVHSVGLHARTRADDAGAHLGYSRRVYVSEGDDRLVPGWYFLKVPSAARDTFALDSWTIGLDVALGPPQAGMSLGHTETRLRARVPAAASALIEYNGPDLRNARLRSCTEDMRCAFP